MFLVTPECKLTPWSSSFLKVFSQTEFILNKISKVPFSYTTFMKMRAASYHWLVIQYRLGNIVPATVVYNVPDMVLLKNLAKL